MVDPSYEIPEWPTRRLRYFNKQFLQAQDFIDEQAFHIAMRNRENRFLRVSGVVEGLAAVQVDAWQFKVGAGTAINSKGQLLLLSADSDSIRLTGPPGTRFIYLNFTEEAPGLQTTDSKSGPDPSHFAQKPTIELRADQRSPPPEGVLLASVSLSDSGIDSIVDLREGSGLQLPVPGGSSSASLRAQAGSLVAAGPAGVQLGYIAANATEATAVLSVASHGVTLGGGLTVKGLLDVSGDITAEGSLNVGHDLSLLPFQNARQVMLDKAQSATDLGDLLNSYIARYRCINVLLKAGTQWTWNTRVQMNDFQRLAITGEGFLSGAAELKVTINMTKNGSYEKAGVDTRVPERLSIGTGAAFSLVGVHLIESAKDERPLTPTAGGALFVANGSRQFCTIELSQIRIETSEHVVGVGERSTLSVLFGWTYIDKVDDSPRDIFAIMSYSGWQFAGGLAAAHVSHTQLGAGVTFEKSPKIVYSGDDPQSEHPKALVHPKMALKPKAVAKPKAAPKPKAAAKPSAVTRASAATKPRTAAKSKGVTKRANHTHRAPEVPTIRVRGRSEDAR